MPDFQLPGGGFITGGSGRQYQLPGGGFITDASTAVSVAIDVPLATLTLTAHAPSVVVTAAPPPPPPPPSATSSGIVSPGLLLTDPLPLALTTQIGAFAAEQVLPQRYGDLRRTRFKLIRMTSTKFIAAGHPMGSITRAFTGDLETSAFESYVESAGAINYMVVEFGAPVPIGSEASASGTGKLHPVTGTLIENPADIMADLLLLAGRTDPWFGQLRAEASAAGIALAGSFAQAISIRDALDVVIDSCGAIWCPGMARLYPAPFDTASGFRLPLDRFNAHGLKVSASLTDTGDVMRLAFDYDEVEDRNQSYVQLEASPRRYGGAIVDVAMPMVRSAAVAESIGRRVLPWYAGQRCDVEFNTPLTRYVRPGTWAQLAEHPQWPFDSDPDLMLTTVLLNQTSRTANVTAEALLSTPTIALTKHSLGSDSIGSGGIEVDIRNGIATLTLRDDDDKPLAGAYVSLDGAPPKKTNGQGQVAFVIAQTGVEHTLDISAPGFEPTTQGITL